MNEIDEVLAKDVSELSSQNLDTLIELYRKQRASFDSGIKPKKGPVEETKGPSLAQKLGLIKQPTITRRI